MAVTPPPVFDWVMVDFLVLGNARISWQINSRFRELEPWSFQLQVAETDLDQGNWVNVGSPVTNTFFTFDPERRGFGKELNVFYRIILTTGSGNVYISQPADVMGKLDLKSFRYGREIIRKELLRLKALRVGSEGFILKAKRSGTPCSVCLDEFTQEVTNSNCPTCFGLRFEGGYFDPQPNVVGDLTEEDNYQQRAQDNDLGMINTQAVKGMFIDTPYLSTMDIWVHKFTDVRYHVHNIHPRTTIRSVPILMVVDLRPIPFDNVVYTFPVVREDPLPCPPECP